MPRRIVPALVALQIGCVAHHGTLRESCESASSRRAHARSGQQKTAIGFGVGVVATVVGIALAAHGSEIRSMESSADSEGGLGPLLGGMLLTSGGLAVAIGSGVGLGVYFARSNDAHVDALRACDGSRSGSGRSGASR